MKEKSILSKQEWVQGHRRYFVIGGLTIQFESDVPVSDETFDHRFKSFQTNQVGSDKILLQHHVGFPDLIHRKLGREFYRKPPWAIYHPGKNWVYLGIAPTLDDPSLHRVAVFNENHTKGQIYSPNENEIRSGALHALTMFPTDQILLARILADREGCYLHAAGVILDHQGLVFVGHSEAGKTTMVSMLQGESAILCDDRVIVRSWPDGLRVYGTWSHGDFSQVSSASAPLRRMFFLHQDQANFLVPIEDWKTVFKELLLFVVKPFVTGDWWEKTLSILAKIAKQVPAYYLHFDRSGRVLNVLRKI